MSDRSPTDQGLEPLDPKVRVLWWMQGIVRTFVLGVAAVPATLALPRIGGVAAWSLVLLSAVTAVVVPVIRYRRWRWAVRDDDVWVRQGILWVTTTVVPFSRLQFVDTRQGPVERSLGLASLVLHTAALNAATAIPGLPVDRAEALRERLGDADPDVISV